MNQLLDIDPSILEKNLLINEDSVDTVTDSLPFFSNNYSPNAPYKSVKPCPGFCVKYRTSSGNKVFINVCHTEEIPAPRDITEDELAELIQSSDLPNFKIPMSIGDPHEEHDKSGVLTTAYDVAVNSKFFSKINESESFCFLFLMIAAEGVQNKYNIELLEDYIILKNRKCLGTLQYHRIKQGSNVKPEAEKKCLIQEISSSHENNSSEKTYNNETLCSEGNKIEYRILKTSIDKNKFLIVEAFLPQAVSSKDLHLDVGEDRLVLNSKKQKDLLDVFFNCNVDENKCNAQFNTQCQVLTVKLPII